MSVCRIKNKYGAPNWSKRRVGRTDCASKKLNSLRAAYTSGSSAACKGARPGFFFGALVDLDGALEVSAIFDHDARGRQIAIDRAILLNLDAVLGAQISFHVAIDHHFPGNYVRGDLRRGAHGELALIELYQSFHRPLDNQVFVAGNFPFHVQTWTEPCRSTICSRSYRTHSICTHCGSSL